MKKIKTIMWQYLWDYNPINQNETKKIRQTINFENLWELIVKFNWLESDIEQAFCEIINDRNHEFGMMIITQMSFIQKNNILDKYISRRINIIWSKKWEIFIKQRKKHYQSLKDIWEFRNKVVHWYWEDQDEFWYIRVSQWTFHEDWIIIQKIKIINKDIKKIIKEIIQLRIKIQDIPYKINLI